MSHLISTRLRRRPGPERSLRTSLLGVAAAAALLLAPFAVPATASWTEPDPGEPAPVAGTNAEVVTTALGPAQRVQAFVANNPTPPDPLAPYPEENPVGVPVTGRFAGIILTEDADGGIGQMYCIDTAVETMIGVGYVQGAWEESNVANIGYVNYILNNYYPANPAVPAGLTTNQQAAAVQGAIWYFTDGYLVNTSETVIRDAVEAIVADAQANGPLVEPPPPNVTVTPPAAAAPVGSVAGPYTVASEGAAEVTVSVPTGYTIYADAAGTTPISSGSVVASGTQVWVGGPPASTTPGVLSARASVSVQTGNVYLYDGGNPGMDNAQPLILAATTVLEATAEATAEFFTAGSLLVSKSFVGEGAGDQDAIQILVDCGAPYVFTVDVPAGQVQDYPTPVDGIPAGSSCTVTEPVTGSNAVVSVVSSAPATVVVPEEGAAVTVTNTVSYNPGALTVTKVLTGAAAGLQGDITVTVSCDAGIEESFTIPAGSAAGEYGGTIADIPAGTSCTVTEPSSGATEQVTVTTGLPEVVTILPGDTSNAVVTNDVSYTFGTLVVAKTISGSGAGLQEEIVLHIQCGDGVLDEIFVVPEGTSAETFTQRYEGLPAGVVCTVSEPASGANEDVTVSSSGTGEVTILPGQVQSVEVVNEYAPVPVTERLPRTGAGSAAGLAAAAGGAVLAGSVLVLGSLRRRRSGS